MARNLYFSDAVKSEQNLYEDIIIESLKMYGQDVYYIPRDLVNEDPIFGDDVPSRFNSSYKLEMYIENTDGFDGEGDLFTKFGVEIRDQATFVVARKRWSDTILRYDNEITGTRPREGDLIYLPMSKSLFQIMAVEHEQPFYQLRDLPTYKLRCELFEYNDEDFDTGVTGVDNIEKDFAYQYTMVFTQSKAVASVLLNGNTIDSFNITNGGKNYQSAPTATFSNLPAINSQVKFGNNTLYPSTADAYSLTSKSGTYSQDAGRGFVDIWVYPNSLPVGSDYQLLYVTGEDTTPTKVYIGLNSSGQLVFMLSTGVSELDINVLENDATNRIIAGQWNHIRLAVRGELTGLSNRDYQAYINGSRVYYSTLFTNGHFQESFSVGGSDTVGSVNFSLLNGYIDEYYSDITNPPISSTITIPTSPYTGLEPNSTSYEDFNTPTPTANVVLTDGVVTSVGIASNNHKYFKLAPTVTFNEPDNLNYTVGEVVTQTYSSGVTISGEVISWSLPTNTLKVAHVGADDGKYHEFITTDLVTGASSTTTAIPDSVTEDNTISENEQNDDFEIEGDSFLDFTETNPFGDPNEA